jgi:hypothetical protein
MMMKNRNVWQTCVDTRSGQKYWYNKLTGHRTWTEPSEEDTVTTIEELKPSIRDIVVQRRLAKALAGLRTMSVRPPHVERRVIANHLSKKKKREVKNVLDDGICGKYEHRIRSPPVITKVELRPDNSFTYSQLRTRKSVTNRVYGNGKWSLVPGFESKSLQLRLDGRFITQDGNVLQQVRNYPFSVFKKEINRLSSTSPARNPPSRIPKDETEMERKARIIDESSDRELTMRVAGDSALQNMISEGKNEALLFALGLRK